MGTKIIHKGLKYISQIFVVKDAELELEIGCPTDVKHVAHIGWDGPSGSAPSWMNEFKTAPDYASTSIGNINESTRGSSAAISPWSSDSESMERQSASELVKDVPPSADRPNIPKKPRRKKVRPATASSPKSVRPTANSSPKSVGPSTNSSPKSVGPSTNSSPKSSSSTRSSSRPPKSKAKFVEDRAKPTDLEVM